MEVWKTKQGLVEVMQELNNGKQLMVRFIETGGIAIASKHKVLAGTVKDPLAPRKAPVKASKPRWNVKLADGSMVTLAELSVASELTGVHLATVYKIAQGVRTNKAIISITRV